MNRSQIILLVIALAFLSWSAFKFFANTEEERTDAEDDTDNEGNPITLPSNTVSNSAQARIAKLLPQVQEALYATIDGLQSQGIDVHVGETLRTESQQQSIVQGGASATNRSWHRLGRAIDVYPINPDTGEPDLAGKRTDLFIALHKEAMSHGFTNISFNADWTKRFITTNKGKIWDGGHIQYTEGLTWDQAYAQYNA